MTDVERGEHENREEDEPLRWVVCDRSWVVLTSEEDRKPVRYELSPGVNEVAAWRAARGEGPTADEGQRRQPG